MTKKPESCLGCPLVAIGKGFARPEGKAKKKLLVVAEALGDNEARDSLPLRPYAQSGSIFERALMALRMSRDDVVIQNVVNCQPPGNVLEGSSYKYAAISHCKPNLDRVVEEYKPSAILALGGVALESLTGLKGKKKGVSSLRGYVLNSSYNIPMIATYHPSFLARGKKNLLGVFYGDMLKATRLAEGKMVEGRDYYLYPQRDYPNNYELSPTQAHVLYEYNNLRAQTDWPFSFDIETADSVHEESEDDITQETTIVTQFQFSLAKGHAVVLTPSMFDTEQQFFGCIANFMSLPNPKLSWNGWRFDQPILEAYGAKIREPHYDLMTLFHHTEPDLPAGLQFAASLYNFPFAWKHLAGEDLAFYGAADVDSLHWIYEPLKEKAIKEGVYGE